MSAYTDADVVLVPTGDGFFTATADLRWEIGAKGSGLAVVVPADFRSDGPSIPGVFSPFFSRRDPRFQKAARLHDWLLFNGWTEWTGTAVFFDALKADGVPRLQRWSMALAVLFYQASK